MFTMVSAMSLALVLSADPKGNVATPLRNALSALAEKTDQPPTMIAVRAALVVLKAGGKGAPNGGVRSGVREGSLDDVLTALTEGATVSLLNRIELVALDNQPAHLQMGTRSPRITSMMPATHSARGLSSSTKGLAASLSPASKTPSAVAPSNTTIEKKSAGTSPSPSSAALVPTGNAIVMENTGLLMGVTARRAGDRVILEVDLERSSLGEDQRTVDITTLQSTLSIASGQTAVLGRVADNRADSQQQLVVLIEAEPLK